jgi:hypothetical protein
MKRRNIIIISVIVAVIALITGYSIFSKDTAIKPLEAEVQRGTFEIVVSVTGELQALRSTEILAPMELRSRELRFRSIQIQDLIPEGTYVDSGDYVATLDRSEADNTYKDIMDQLEVIQSQYTKTKLDTTMNLSSLRDQIINLRYNMEEAEITLEQSQFEPPTTIRQAKINLDKAKRAYEQAVENYELEVQQSKADMTEATINLAKQVRKKEEIEKVLNSFVIRAPASGMVIYKREWNGQKRTVGSEIRTFDLAVAELPDMSTMISKTYVNEIDISKVQTGQKVRIGIDAFPEKSFTGVVTEVANVGEQLPNTDAKVFEVVIKLDEVDPIMRPSMTTSNLIITQTFDNVLFIPLETVHTNDSLPFVYKKNGVKQVVVLDEANENQIIVEAGLSEGEEVMLSVPEEPEKFKWEGLELAQIIREKELEEQRLEQEQKALYEQRINGRSSGAMGTPDSRFPEQMDMPSGFRRDTTGRFPGQMDRPAGFRRDTTNREYQQTRRSTDRGS